MNPETPNHNPFFNNKWLRRLAIAHVSLLLLWAIAWLAVPPLLKGQLETRLLEQLGRRVTIGQLDFKPWSLEFTLHDLLMARAAGAVADSPQLSIKRIYIDAELRSLLQLAPVVDALAVDAPHLNLTYLGDGHFDVDDVLAKLVAEPAEPAASPLRFALYNLVLRDGALTFKDATQGRSHTVANLQLNLPFLSNLDSKRDVRVQPLLAFDLNGSRFDSSAQGTPFAQTRKTEARFSFKQMNLAPYLAYLPASLPIRLDSAVLSADLTLAFEQASRPAVTLSGTVAASQVKLAAADRAGRAAHAGVKKPGSLDLLQFDQLTVQLKAVQPLAQEVQLGQVELTQPRLTLRRDRAGALNWLVLLEPAIEPKNGIQTIAINAGRASAGGEKSINSEQAVAAPSWKLGVDQLVLRGGEIFWSDDRQPKPVQLALTALELQARSLAWPVTQPMPFEGSARLAAATLNFKGAATDQAANLAAQLTDLPLSLAAPYLAAFMTPTLDGVGTAELGLNWKAARAPDTSEEIQLQIPHVTLNKLLLSDNSRHLASVKQLQLEGLVLDLKQQTAVLKQISVVQPKTGVVRAQNGRWMFQDWLKMPPEPSRAQSLTPQLASTAPPSGAAGSVKPWSLMVNDFQLTDGVASFQDQQNPRPVNLQLSALSVHIKNLATAGGQPFGLNLSARLRHGNTGPGSLSWRGTSTLTPLTVQGDLNAVRLPLHALEPYFDKALNVDLLRADASFKGKIDLAQQADGVAVKVRGDSRLEDFQLQTLTQSDTFKSAEELLNWKSLNLNGLELAMHPGTATRLGVQGMVLSDFYARLVLSETGRLSLQDVVKSAAPDDTGPPAGSHAGNSDTTKSEAIDAMPERARVQNIDKSGPSPQIHIGPVSLIGGRVDFTDRFIKPNYAATLTELAGKLGAFASQSAAGEVQLAELELRGRVEGTATLEVQGKVNPLAKPLALDIKGRVRDLELPPLSPYAVRYAGYGIERGKLSVDVAYLVQPDGQLTASNQLTLKQLKFGDKVPDAPTSLPVKLAVALLADRNGVIDINLPVSGSLNDPQFRLLPIVFKIVGNLIARAITAPFSLLASALGGGDELGSVSFEPGSADLTAAAKAGLDKVAKALQDRPALKMTVIGSASLTGEREAFKRAKLQALLLAEQRRAASAGAAAPVVADADADAAAASAQAPVTKVSAQDHPALLKAVYQRADFPKPRNLLGLTKDIPAPDMEALLLAHLNAAEPDLLALAVKRGVVVRDYLSSLKLPTDRLFLGVAKTVSADPQWQPHAELNLTMD